jgi:Fur family ferric uptake transcriptional regulator
MERHTRQRQAVVDALARSGQALSPQDLLVQAKSAVPSLNLSTVYRQIKGLQDAGQIVRVELPGQPARFEMAARDLAATPSGHRHDAHSAPQAAPASDEALQHLHHHHFHCIQCDRVYPIHACPGPMNDLAPPGFEVQHHDLTLRGRCASCVAGAAA